MEITQSFEQLRKMLEPSHRQRAKEEVQHLLQGKDPSNYDKESPSQTGIINRGGVSGAGGPKRKIKINKNFNSAQVIANDVGGLLSRSWTGISSYEPINRPSYIFGEVAPLKVDHGNFFNNLTRPEND